MRWKRISCLATVLLMALCFVMSSTDLILREEVEEVKKISVIVSARENSYLNNFKAGILEAAGDSRADVNYVMLPEGKQERAARIERELTGNAQAVILFAEDLENSEDYVSGKAEGLPVITVNTFGSVKGQTADVSFNLQEAAEELAAAVSEKEGGKRQIVLLTNGKGISGRISQTLARIFWEKGLAVEVAEAEEEAIEKKREQDPEAVFVGCWVTDTEQALKCLDGAPLYGVGSSNEILRSIMEGNTEGVAAFGMYSAGMYAIQQAVAAMEGTAKDIRISCRLITKENVKEEQEFLIPIY